MRYSKFAPGSVCRSRNGRGEPHDVYKYERIFPE